MVSGQLIRLQFFIILLKVQSGYNYHVLVYLFSTAKILQSHIFLIQVW